MRDNRELKFRAWDGTRMIYFDELTIGLEKGKKVKPYVYFKNDTFNGEVRLGRHHVMQYIGVKDKNGKEICEGDIVNGADFNGKYDYGLVVYWKCEFILEPFGKFVEGIADIYNELSHIEVIGNKHENPELFKKFERI